MIEANELRIGNYIYDYECSNYYPIEEICTLSKDSLNQNIGVKYRNKSAWTDCDYLQAIPITEEILLKCGFEPIKTIANRGISSRRFYHIGTFVVEILANNRTAVYYTRMQELICYIESFHQLQNLYFALTNEELNVNL